jgi:hypothetical protein
MKHSQFIKFKLPSGFFVGLAMNPLKNKMKIKFKENNLIISNGSHLLQMDDLCAMLYALQLIFQSQYQTLCDFSLEFI